MTESTPWQISRAAVSAIERGQNFPGMEAMLALSNVLFVDPKELVERARISTSVPVDVTDVGADELEARAARHFWAGRFREALAVYDALAERYALEEQPDPRRMAILEVRRATALKRSGALISAIGRAENAITLSAPFPDVQCEAYVALADLQCQRGLLPLASDAAARAIELAEAHGSEQARMWAWMVKAHVQFLAGQFARARESWVEARRRATAIGDDTHLSHIEGDIGLTYMESDEPQEARRWIRRALERARRRGLPALEASWLVVLGRLALLAGDPDEADACAVSALRIARPRDNHITVFRAEWLRHRVVRRKYPSRSDGRRLARLRKLFLRLDQHEGVPEIREFKATLLTADAHEGPTR